jgi:hypothetical protein
VVLHDNPGLKRWADKGRQTRIDRRPTLDRGPDRRRGSGSDQTMGARQMTVNIDLLDAELKVAQTECDDIDTAIAQIAVDDADAKAKFIELRERRQIAGERLSRISTALTEARSGSAWLQHAADRSVPRSYPGHWSPAAAAASRPSATLAKSRIRDNV